MQEHLRTPGTREGRRGETGAQRLHGLRRGNELPGERPPIRPAAHSVPERDMENVGMRTARRNTIRNNDPETSSVIALPS